MKLGITGAGGQLGGLLTNYALKNAAASDVVLITRNPDKLAANKAEARAGDFNDPAGLAEAFKGIDKLVMIPTGDLTPGVRTKQQGDAIAAAVKAGVKHIIYISTVSPRPSDNVLFDSHFRTEQNLIASGAKWTILRMGVYTDSLMGGVQGAVASGAYAAIEGAPAAYCTRDDIAAAAAGILTSEGHEGITYHATGPASIDQAAVAAAVAKAAGKEIKLTPITEDDQRKTLASMGLPPALVDGIVGFGRGLRSGAFDLVTHDVERLSGRPATSVEEFLKKALA